MFFGCCKRSLQPWTKLLRRGVYSRWKLLGIGELNLFDHGCSPVRTCNSTCVPSLSYMAVTGLPEPQEDHAITMAKFAIDCTKTMQAVTSKLAERLGNDTVSLSLRMGLVSGSLFFLVRFDVCAWCVLPLT